MTTDDWAIPSLYGDAVADIYDPFTARSLSPDYAQESEFLAGRAAGGRVLELGVGTGRAALPLARHGLTVTGIEASRKMIDVLSSKDTAGQVTVVQGDFAEVGVDGNFELIYVTLNTFCQLITQEAQQRCLRNVALKLEPHGRFVIATWARGPRLEDDQVLKVWDITPHEVHLEASTWNSDSQVLSSQHIILSNGSVRLNPMVHRIVTVSELDLMANIAGLRLSERFAGWDETAFGPESKTHVSVYEPCIPD